MSEIKLCAIVAMAQNRVIGKDNDLIWHIPEDLKHFKRTTLGKPIIMGRKSYESIGKPLPGRDTIVITRSGQISPNPNSKKPEKLSENATATGTLQIVTGIDEAITLGMKIARDKNLSEIFITGGGEIYKQTLPRIDRLYLTLIHRDYEGDTYFPGINWATWAITNESKHEGAPAFTIYTLDKK